MNAEVAELVDALDSKSSSTQIEWGFESPLRHKSKNPPIKLRS
jgi:hypothetical protein